MTIKPLADRVFIEPLTAVEITKGGIIIPDMAKKNQNIGIVRAVGICHEGDEPLSVGDKVLFQENAGSEHKEDGKTYRIVRFSNVLLKYENVGV